MAMSPGDAVTSIRCPDWGTGVVLSVGPTSAEVEFPVLGRKRLLLEVLIPSSEPAPVFPKKGRKSPATTARSKKGSVTSPQAGMSP